MRPEPVDPHVFLRGNPGRPGKAVPRRFLRVLAGPGAAAVQEGQRPARAGPGDRRPEEPADGPGAGQPGLALAFRQGTGRPRPATSACGATRRPIPSCSITWPAGSSPTAGRSRRCTGGSCCRTPTSRASDPRPDAAERDPENRLVWRFNRAAARLRVDARLASWRSRAASTRRSAGGRCTITEAPFSARRTVYGFIDRQNLDGLYRTFDFAVPDATSPRRFVTTVPQQALFLMNSPFLHEQARAAGRDDPPRGLARDPIRGHPPALPRASFGRSPEPDELALATAFLRRQSGPPTPPFGRLDAVCDHQQGRRRAFALGAARPGAVADQRVHVRRLTGRCTDAGITPSPCPIDA